MLLTIISFVVVFTVIALTHELGHLVFAKRAGIRVYELALGFGPRLFSFKRNHTVYAINLIPILGYVRIAGEGEAEEDRDCPEEEKLYYKKPFQKFKALAAGSLMNILTAFILLTFIFILVGIPTGVSNEIGSVTKNSSADIAGLKPGDRLLAINGRPFKKMEDAIELIHQSGGKSLLLTIERKQLHLKIKATPLYNPKLKMSLLGFSPKPIYKRVNPFIALYYGLVQTASMALVVLYIIWKLIVGAVSVRDLAGPVGIAQITGRYAHSGIISLVNFTAFLSVNVGILNLLPIPALDGGRLLFVLIEWIRKKAVDPALENKINYWGFMVLLAIMALITLNDILRILLNR